MFLKYLRSGTPATAALDCTGPSALSSNGCSAVLHEGSHGTHLSKCQCLKCASALTVCITSQDSGHNAGAFLLCSL